MIDERDEPEHEAQVLPAHAAARFHDAVLDRDASSHRGARS